MNPPLTDQLTYCTCCPRECGVNRLQGETGFCGIGALAEVAHVGLHFGEEPPISGRRGSGTIFFTGCNLHCVFCQNYQISQQAHLLATRRLSTTQLASEMLSLQGAGAHNINLVSPSHVVWQAAEAIIEAKHRGLTIPIVYNSNGYDSVDALRQIRGLVDIYLPDIKYMDNSLGRRYSGVEDYAEIIPQVLVEMLAQVVHLRKDSKGIALSGMLVRHLVLPGHVDNSRKCLALLADIAPQIAVSLMSQYSPQHRASAYAKINRTLTSREYEAILDYALELGLDNAFVQEMDSNEEYLPDFESENPFAAEHCDHTGV